jgi:hypothetical protein
MAVDPKQFESGETEGIEDAALGYSPCTHEALTRRRGRDFADGYVYGYSQVEHPPRRRLHIGAGLRTRLQRILDRK